MTCLGCMQEREDAAIRHFGITYAQTMKNTWVCSDFAAPNGDLRPTKFWAEVRLTCLCTIVMINMRGGAVW